MRAGERQRRGSGLRNRRAAFAAGNSNGSRPANAERLGLGIASLQRARLVNAAVGLLAEQGYGAASVSAICARAGVSRRTYYEIFENREACLAAILTDVEARVQGAIAAAGSAKDTWQQRVRAGLWAILCLADSEPALARACLIESQRGSGRVSAERERILLRLAAAIDEGRLHSSRGAQAGALTAEALVGAVAAVVTARLGGSQLPRASDRTPPLRELLCDLMSMIVLPYLGAGAAKRELERPLPEAPAMPQVEHAPVMDGPDPLAGLPLRLTYRTARALQAVAQLAERGAGVSNREIAERAGVLDVGQISKLLARLEHHGLLANAVKGKRAQGEANSWTLTSAGERLVRGIGAEVPAAPEEAQRATKQARRG